MTNWIIHLKEADIEILRDIQNIIKYQGINRFNPKIYCLFKSLTYNSKMNSRSMWVRIGIRLILDKIGFSENFQILIQFCFKGLKVFEKDYFR